SPTVPSRFQPPADHRDLHSFPTRRSSDLEELPVFFPRPHAIGLNTTADVGYTASLAVNQLAAVDYANEQVNLVPVPGRSAALMQDRKSTRLNSSHVKISYAVFCLKKKKKR